MEKRKTRYVWTDDNYKNGIPESFPVDSQGKYPRSPYGCSKYTGDMYCQEYYHIYGVPTVVNRQSCLAEGTIIPTILGNKKIENINENDMVYSFNHNNKEIVKCHVIKAFRTNSINKKLYKVTTRRGKTIEATGEHKFLTPSGFVELQELNFGSLVLVAPSLADGIEKNNINKIIVSETLFDEEIQKLNFVRKQLYNEKFEDMKKLGLLPFSINNKYISIITEFLGYCFGDANFNIVKKKDRQSSQLQLQVYGKPEDLKEIIFNLDYIGIKHGEVQSNKCISKLSNGHIISGMSYRFTINDSGFLTLMKLLGLPMGDKAITKVNIPSWILDGEKNIKKYFLRGLFGAELSRIKYSQNKKYFGGLLFYQSKDEVILENGIEYLQEIKNILKEFEVETTPIKSFGKYYRKSGIITSGIQFKIKSKKDNIYRFSNIGFAYVQDRINSLFEFIDCYRENISGNSFEEWKEFYTRNLIDSTFMWDTVDSIEEIKMKPIYDLTIDEEHNFIASGFLVHNCIAGKWQQGCEDQGWMAWFVFAKMFNSLVTIFGDGFQVRDVLDVDDLATLYLLELQEIASCKGKVFNVGGGIENTCSLIEAMEHMVALDGRCFNLIYKNWRLADQRIYISDISKVTKELGWKPKTNPIETIDNIWNWAVANRSNVWKVFVEIIRRR